MRRGCISLGDVVCHNCHTAIAYPERYLATDIDENGEETESGKTARFCSACAIEKGMARFREEKGDRILTFFTD